MQDLAGPLHDSPNMVPSRLLPDWLWERLSASPLLLNQVSLERLAAPEPIQMPAGDVCHAEHIHHRRTRRRRFDISRCQGVRSELGAEHDCGGMRAGNGRYSFDKSVMRDYNAPDFAK